MDSMKDTLSDVYYPSEIPDLDFDLLHDITYDFNLLGEDDLEMSSTSIKQELSPCRSDNSELSLLESFNSADSPPLTPPGSDSMFQQHLNIENESNNNVLVLNGSAPGFPKILPALKSSRGRSASHDSPDLQALKRHIRMIRNRESASLSRKKKKEYLTGLESRVKELEIENAKLKHENCVLKARLGQFLNGSAISSAKNIASMLTSNGKTKGMPSVTAKVALLGLCCFMFISYQKPAFVMRNNSSDVHGMTIQPLSMSLAEEVSNIPVFHPADQKLRARKPVYWKAGSVKALRWKDRLNETSFNDTHEGSLEDADGKPTYDNVTMSEQASTNCATPFNMTEAKRVQDDLKGIFSHKAPPKAPIHAKPIVYSLIDSPSNEDKGLAVYDAKIRRFSRVLDQLNRRSDTFYVVSLAVDNQLLLSAKSVNASSRPKMSFLMPWKNDTHGGKEELMQIDCEVTQVYNLDRRNQRRSKKYAK